VPLAVWRWQDPAGAEGRQARFTLTVCPHVPQSQLLGVEVLLLVCISRLYQHALFHAAIALVPAGAERCPSTSDRGASGPCTDARRAAPQGREKIALIELFTVMGFDILITDVDAVWCAVRRARRCMAEPAVASRSTPEHAADRPSSISWAAAGSRAAPR